MAKQIKRPRRKVTTKKGRAVVITPRDIQNIRDKLEAGVPLLQLSLWWGIPRSTLRRLIIDVEKYEKELIKNL